jgi:multiple antibiotic resistance protein
MDPIGNVPLYIAILQHVPQNRRKKIIVREMLISLFIILLFALVGEGILNLLKISPASLSISGGILLFIISLKMIFSGSLSDNAIADHKTEPFIVPLAVPLIAGPSILAAVMIFAKKEQNTPILLGSILIAWVLSFIILILSDELKRILKENALQALERLMGLILTLIAVQMFLEGFENFFTHMNHAL